MSTGPAHLTGDGPGALAGTGANSGDGRSGGGGPAPSALALVREADELAAGGQLDAAAAAYRAALVADPADATAHNNLGWVLERTGRLGAAVDHYRAALDLRPGDTTMRRNLAIALTWSGRHDEAAPLWVTDLTTTADGVARMDHRIGDEMRAGRLDAAAALARVFALVRHGTASALAAPDDGAPAAAATDGTAAIADGPWRAPRQISVPKLAHDVEQFRHLQQRGVLSDAYDEVIAAYEATARRWAHLGVEGRAPLDDEAWRDIGATYGRLVHVAAAPEVDHALSGRWDPAVAEREYLDHRAGVVVVDDFLSPLALELLQRFVNDSTIWFATRYTHGRLGTFFRDGFNSPLLLQIANELRDAMPNVIGDRHPLRQLWAFKNTPTVPPDATVHADFAAVNVNFWVTPTHHNLDPGSGGFVLYDVGAPPDWDFYTYNGRHDLIRDYLRRTGARAMRVPYRCNRAVIFNSDLFHETAAVRFAPGYEARRVNVTFLYGEREQDAHHPTSELAPVVAHDVHWRSPALAATGLRRP